MKDLKTAKFLKSLSFCLVKAGDATQKVVGFWVIFFLLMGSTKGQAQSNLILADLMPETSATHVSNDIEVLESMGAGFRSESYNFQLVNRSLALSVYSYHSNYSDFGDDRLNRTQEDGFEAHLEKRDRFDNTWSTKLQSFDTSQDSEQFSTEYTLDQFRHRVMILSQGWKKEIYKNIDVSLMTGVSYNVRDGAPKVEWVPVGNMGVSFSHDWGTLGLRIGQWVDGNGAMSGIYGSQIKREIGIESKINLTSKLKLNADCALSKVKGVFDEIEILDTAPIFLANAKLEYALNDNLSLDLGYFYRNEFSKESDLLAVGSSGSVGSFGFSYTAF